MFRRLLDAEIMQTRDCSDCRIDARLGSMEVGAFIGT
jgi:hypothetical protein